MQQLLTEGFPLSVLGVAVKLQITAALMRLLWQISLPIPFPLELHVDFDTRVMTVAAAMVVIRTPMTTPIAFAFVTSRMVRS